MIMMLGTDHTLASAEVRSSLYLANNQRVPAMQRIRDAVGADGVVMLSTCNRMEIWLSAAGTGESAEPGRERSELFWDACCSEFGLDPDSAGAHFVQRVDEDAVEHLFHLSCGLKSAILAEDQIVSQVTQAIAFSRDEGLADSRLEVLFRTAVTAAKKVKTNVCFAHADGTAVESAINLLHDQGMDLAGKTCMVIGNGTYGKLAASSLHTQGARVLVTVRQYHRGRVEVPKGCMGVPYGDRYRLIPECDVVVSATVSPHFTLVRSQLEASLEKANRTDPLVLLDMAIPQDIDPDISGLEQCRLYDIDCFQSGLDEVNHDALAQTEMLLHSEMDEFWSWLARRELLPQVQAIYESAERNMAVRIQSRISALPLDARERADLLEYLSGAAGRVVRRAIFDLQEYLSEEEYDSALRGLGAAGNRERRGF